MWYISVARKTRENNKSDCHAQLWQSHRKETKMVQKNLVAASLQAKKGRLYAVIQRKCPNGKFKSVWLEKAAKDLQINTYNSYHSMIYGKIRRYFERRDPSSRRSKTS